MHQLLLGMAEMYPGTERSASAWRRFAAALEQLPWSARWSWSRSWWPWQQQPREARAAVAVAAVVVVAVLVKLDRMGPLAGLNFQPRPHPIAPLHRVTAEWPKDVGWSSLSKARVRFGADAATAVMGPESLEFDADGVGPYTGVADGRVVRWKDGKWETFAIVSPTWDESCTTQLKKRGSDNNKGHDEPRCGRPLGLKFDKSSGRLYIADAYLGLHSVGPEGGRAVPVGRGKCEVVFANDLDLHPNGSIFFTDSSQRWRRQQYVMLLLEGDDTGRLLRHDPASGATQVVLSGLNFPNGVAVSRDGSYLLLAETLNARLLRVPLHSHGQPEVVADLAGYPDNVRRNREGHFWVAINGPRTALQQAGSRSVWLKKLLLKLPLPLQACLWLFRPWPRPYPTVALVDGGAVGSGRGRLLRVLDERSGRVIKSVSEVQERDGCLWMGSVAHNQIATLHLNNNESVTPVVD